MRVLFDTSVLVASVIEAHPLHDRCLPWLEKARRQAIEFLVAAHSIAELYAVLSAYPTRPRIAPGVAARLVRENVAAAAEVVALSGADYESAIQATAEMSLSGGVVYDALIARAAQKAKVAKLLTLNPRDFLRVWPAGAGIVASP